MSRRDVRAEAAAHAPEVTAAPQPARPVAAATPRLQRVLHAGDGWELRDVRCRAPRTERAPEEASSRHELVFPRRGFFVRRGARGDAAADAAGVLFFTRDEPYRVEHPVDGGDDCTAMVVDDATLLEALGRRVPAAADRPSAPFPVPWAPTSTRTVAALHALRLALATRHPDAIALDEACHDVLSLVVDDLAAHVGRPRTALRAVTVAEHRERVDAARSFLARRHADPLRLADVAREAACSPFHLTRLFRAHVGVPLHRHLRRLRLRAAMDRLASGETNLAAVAVAVGFASHSHFTDAFRRELGVPPSAWRALGRSAREMRKILEA